MTPLPEAAEKQQMTRLLRGLGFRVWSTSQVRRSTVTPGLPDLFVTGRGRLFSIEVKAPAGRLSAEQALWCAAANAADFPHVVGGVTEVTAFLRRIGVLV